MIDRLIRARKRQPLGTFGGVRRRPHGEEQSDGCGDGGDWERDRLSRVVTVQSRVAWTKRKELGLAHSLTRRAGTGGPGAALAQLWSEHTAQPEAAAGAWRGVVRRRRKMGSRARAGGVGSAACPK